MRREMEDLKSALTQAEDLATRTQTQLAACDHALREERATVERLGRSLRDEETKSRLLETTVVDLYAELESKEAEAKSGAAGLCRQQLRAAEEDNGRLRDALRVAEKRVEELEQSLRTGDG